MTERVEEIAKAFHGTYERLASKYGHETRKDSAVLWDEVPENNRMLMMAVVEEVVLPIIATLDQVDCKCSCCIESRNRKEHNRVDWEDWCSCPDYLEDEQCDCRHCLRILNVLLRDKVEHLNECIVNNGTELTRVEQQRKDFYDSWQNACRIITKLKSASKSGFMMAQYGYCSKCSDPLLKNGECGYCGKLTAPDSSGGKDAP